MENLNQSLTVRPEATRRILFYMFRGLLFWVWLVVAAAGCSKLGNTPTEREQADDTLLGGGSTFGNPLISVPLYFDSSGVLGDYDYKIKMCIQRVDWLGSAPMLGSSVTPVTRMSTRSGPSDQASNYDETPALNVEDWTIRNKSRRDLIRYGEVSAEKLIFGVQLHLAPGCIKDSKASLVIDRGQGELAFSEQNFVLTFLMDTPRTVGARQDLILRNDKLIQTLLNAEPPDWTFVPGSVFIENR